jgi:hypothetical protein
MIGKWSVHDVTHALQGKDAAGVGETLALLDSGHLDAGSLLSRAASSPAIRVELLDSGLMSMSIIQSMGPDLPASMQIRASIAWEVEGERMVTQAMADELAARVAIDPDHRLTEAQLGELKGKIPEIEAGAVREMKANPVWTSRNTVAVVYCGKRCFLTRSETGAMMLHQRI